MSNRSHTGSNISLGLKQYYSSLNDCDRHKIKSNISLGKIQKSIERDKADKKSYLRVSQYIKHGYFNHNIV